MQVSEVFGRHGIRSEQENFVEREVPRTVSREVLLQRCGEISVGAASTARKGGRLLFFRTEIWSRVR